MYRSVDMHQHTHVSLIQHHPLLFYVSMQFPAFLQLASFQVCIHQRRENGQVRYHAVLLHLHHYTLSLIAVPRLHVDHHERRVDMLIGGKPLLSWIGYSPGIRRNSVQLATHYQHERLP